MKIQNVSESLQRSQEPRDSRHNRKLIVTSKLFLRDANCHYEFMDF